jgi:PAS domain S-box-containing protein
MIARFGVVKLTLILTLLCVLSSLLVFLILSHITGYTRPFGIFISLITPLIVAPPVCIILLKVARLLYVAQDELLRAQEVLERKVADRTQELFKANEQLRNEIQERKQAEEELRRMNVFLDSIVENIPNMIFLKDAKELRFISFNRAGEELLGNSREDLIGKNDYDFFPKEQADFFTQKDREALSGKEVIVIPEETVQTCKGERILKTKKVPILNAMGEPEYLLGISEDITLQKQAEEAQARQAEEWQTTFDGVRDAIWLLDAGQHILRTNRTAEEIFGRPAEAMLGKHCWEIAHGSQEPIPECPILRMRRSLQREQMELQIGERFFIVTVDPILNADGKLTGAVHLVSDITARKQAEKALRDSEEIFRNVFDNHAAVKLLIDPDTGNIIGANKVAAEYYGWPKEELCRMNIRDINTLSQDAVKQEMEKARTLQRTYFEFRHRRADGTVRDVSVFSSNIKTKGKAVLHSIVHDITAQKAAEEAMRESEEKYRLIFENSPLGHLFFDEKGVIIACNNNFVQIIGSSREALIGLNMLNLPDKNIVSTVQKALNGSTGLYESVYHSVTAKKVTPVRAFFAPMISEGGCVLGGVGIIEDVSDRKQAEEEKRILQERLQHADKMEAIGTLAGGIAHDFNNLLMGIQGYASLILLDIDPSDPHYEKLKRIEEQVQSGADLTRQLLGFARGGRYEVKPADMNEILEKSSSMFGRTKKEITIHRKYAKDLFTVEVDRGQMEQVFMNLYVNAWQAMPGGGALYLETENVLLDDDQAFSYAVKPGNYIKISMTDTGTGMDTKTCERIFDPFFTTKEMGRGTGLGLATVYGIIKGHKGMINAYSEPGHGTTFTIYLPASEKKVVKEKTETGTIVRGTETILLVDDEKIVLNVCSEILRSLGYRVYTAGSGQEAINVYIEKKSEIDLVILDMIMPGMSGGETFDHLRKLNPLAKIILSSGYSINRQAQEIMDKGCNGFIQKPFQLQILSSKIREMLDME